MLFLFPRVTQEIQWRVISTQDEYIKQFFIQLNHMLVNLCIFILQIDRKTKLQTIYINKIMHPTSKIDNIFNLHNKSLKNDRTYYKYLNACMNTKSPFLINYMFIYVLLAHLTQYMPPLVVIFHFPPLKAFFLKELQLRVLHVTKPNNGISLYFYISLLVDHVISFQTQFLLVLINNGWFLHNFRCIDSMYYCCDFSNSQQLSFTSMILILTLLTSLIMLIAIKLFEFFLGNDIPISFPFELFPPLCITNPLKYFSQTIVTQRPHGEFTHKNKHNIY